MSEEKQKSWFSRHWGWLLGGGCLLFIVIIVVVGVGAFYKITNSIQESEPYSYAFSKAIENDKVIAILGEPIESNGIGSSNFKYKNNSGEATLIIPIKGPNGVGTILVEAEKHQAIWFYNELSVVIEGEQGKINLNASEVEAGFK